MPPGVLVIENMDQVRLMDLKGLGSHQAYATLSYCWGPIHGTCSHLNGPKTLYALACTPHRWREPLQMQFLFVKTPTLTFGVDSLCVVQDGPEHSDEWSTLR